MESCEKLLLDYARNNFFFFFSSVANKLIILEQWKYMNDKTWRKNNKHRIVCRFIVTWRLKLCNLSKAMNTGALHTFFFGQSFVIHLCISEASFVRSRFNYNLMKRTTNLHFLMRSCVIYCTSIWYWYCDLRLWHV